MTKKMTKEDALNMLTSYSVAARVAVEMAEAGRVYTNLETRELNVLVDLVRMRERFPENGDVEKAMRWLGYAQGVMAMAGIYTLEQLIDHSRRKRVGLRLSEASGAPRGATGPIRGEPEVQAAPPRREDARTLASRRMFDRYLVLIHEVGGVLSSRRIVVTCATELDEHLRDLDMSAFFQAKTDEETGTKMLDVIERHLIDKMTRGEWTPARPEPASPCPRCGDRGLTDSNQTCSKCGYPSQEKDPRDDVDMSADYSFGYSWPKK